MEKLGKYQLKATTEYLHRFTREKASIRFYENGQVVERHFFDRKTGSYVAWYSSKDNTVYLESFRKNKKEFKAACNEAVRLCKTDKVSEFFQYLIRRCLYGLCKQKIS